MASLDLIQVPPVPFQPILSRGRDEIVQLQFSKRFSFPSYTSSATSTQPYSTSRWSDPTLQAMKKKLNETKSQLSKIPQNKRLKHGRHMDPAGSVISVLRKNIKPELLTHAWSKFHELFHVYCLGPHDHDSHQGTQPVEFNSVHLCEAPGAFVTSLNHALCLHHRNTAWNWVATTLNPHYEGNDLGLMVNDDRFIMSSLNNWHFGEDDTGDLLVKENMSSLVERAKEFGNTGLVHLVTADGSIDCHFDPSRQENIVSDLHMAEIVTALQILGEGGNLVIKLFTLFESETVCLLYLLATVFTSLDMFKPATSKETNSEVYVVARGLIRSEWLGKILVHLTDLKIFGKFPREKSLFSKEEIPSSFLDSVRECGDLFMKFQENAIRNYLHYWKNPMSPSELEEMAEIKTDIAALYLSKYKVSKINNDQFCEGARERKCPSINQIDQTTYRGNVVLDRDREITLASIRSNVSGWRFDGRIRFVNWVKTPSLGKTLNNSIIGKKLTMVLNSKFCTGGYLQCYNQTIKIIQDQEENGQRSKRRKGKDTQNYQDSIGNMETLKDAFVTLKKLTYMFPEIVQITKVLRVNYNKVSDTLLDGCGTENQIMLINTILNAIAELERGQHLLIPGLPLFTRLDIAIFYCLAYLFEEIGFVKPDGNEDFLFFSNFLGKNINIEESISILEKILTHLSSKSEEKQVLSVWAMEDLVNDNMYEEIILFNQRRIKEKILFMTENIDSSQEGFPTKASIFND